MNCCLDIHIHIHVLNRQHWCWAAIVTLGRIVKRECVYTYTTEDSYDCLDLIVRKPNKKIAV